MDPVVELVLLVKAVHRDIERRINEAMQPMGLTSAQADAIQVIAQKQPLSLKELGGLLIAEAGHPSRLVDHLVEAGLVERRVAAGDRRRVELSLTAAGRRLHKRVLLARQRVTALGHQLIGTRDITPALEVLREIGRQSAYAELIARRHDLAEPVSVGEPLPVSGETR